MTRTIQSTHPAFHKNLPQPTVQNRLAARRTQGVSAYCSLRPLPIPCKRVHTAAMKIRKAVITAAGRSQRTIPLQSFVDRDGVPKSALQILIEETLSAGVEEVCIVIDPGDRAAYTQAAGEHTRR